MGEIQTKWFKRSDAAQHDFIEAEFRIPRGGLAAALNQRVMGPSGAGQDMQGIAA